MFSYVVRECARFENFNQIGSFYLLETTDTEALQRWAGFQVILLNAYTWASFQLKLNEEIVLDKVNVKKWFYSLQEVRQCINEYSEVSSPDQFCRESAWGCRKLKSVEFLPDFYDRNKGWFTFGSLEDGKWKIDKMKVVQVLAREAELKHLESCPNFDIDRIVRAVHALPPYIDIATRNWKLVTSIQLVDGEYRNAVSGIEWIGRYIDYNPKEIILNALK